MIFCNKCIKYANWSCEIPRENFLKTPQNSFGKCARSVPKNWSSCKVHGVVSLLEDTYYRQVEDLWAELEREFGVRGVYVTPYPHFSYQIASHYDIEVLEPI